VHGKVLVVLLIVAYSTSSIDQAFGQVSDPPQLILQITVDQLRGDLLTRYYDRLGKGGFRYLMDEGTWYTNAHHAHANTETIVGHATLATGAYPSRHGMVGNVWFDRAEGRLIYNIEDSRYPIVGSKEMVDRETEIDPTQAISRSDGRSPAAILASTFSDELAMFYGGQSKIFGVSVKDRGAVALAGHAGKAYWFSKAAAEFVSSTFYFDTYPAWVTEWNNKRLADTWHEKSWELLHVPSTYMFGDRDDRPYEVDFPGYGRTFPHSFGDKSGKYFTTLLTISPVGDQLTLDFAMALIENEGIGEDDIPDYLSVSFSSTDYVGHFFGASSLESEDNILQLDRTIAELLEAVDDKVGLKQTLIVLSSDHGGAETPGYLNELGIEAAYVDVDAFDTAPAISALKEHFGVSEELIEEFFPPYIYLNRAVMDERGLNPDEVEDAVATEIEKFKGVALAIPSNRLRTGNVPDTATVKAVLRNYNPRRSGDIYVVFEPHSFINDMEGLRVATTHGSPWSYDTYVPVIFAGANVPAQRVLRQIETIDIAPTLSAYVGAKPPSGSVGTPLLEVFIEQ
jgi:hypothetical protein